MKYLLARNTCEGEVYFDASPEVICNIGYFEQRYPHPVRSKAKRSKKCAIPGPAI